MTGNVSIGEKAKSFGFSTLVGGMGGAFLGAVISIPLGPAAALPIILGLAGTGGSIGALQDVITKVSGIADKRSFEGLDIIKNFVVVFQNKTINIIDDVAPFCFAGVTAAGLTYLVNLKSPDKECSDHPLSISCLHFIPLNCIATYGIIKLTFDLLRHTSEKLQKPDDAPDNTLARVREISMGGDSSPAAIQCLKDWAETPMSQKK